MQGLQGWDWLGLQGAGGIARGYYESQGITGGLHGSGSHGGALGPGLEVQAEGGGAVVLAADGEPEGEGPLQRSRVRRILMR